MLFRFWYNTLELGVKAERTVPTKYELIRYDENVHPYEIYYGSIVIATGRSSEHDEEMIRLLSKTACLCEMLVKDRWRELRH